MIKFSIRLFLFICTLSLSAIQGVEGLCGDKACVVVSPEKTDRIVLLVKFCNISYMIIITDI
jgi:hypothetical protein